MAEDVYENELIEDNSPQWIRTIDDNGNSKKTKKDVFIKNSDRVTLKKARMPTVSDDAIKLATISIPVGFYNASIFVKLDMFQLSCYGVIGIYRANTGVTPFAKLNGFCISTISNILFIDNGTAIDIYITGNYNTGYTTFFSDIFSSSECIDIENIGYIVPASFLNNVIKSINIHEALQ